MNNFLFLILCTLILHVTENRLLTQDDYTLYFDEYHFDWDNGGDWHVITADNTQKKDGKGFTQIVACTLHIKGLKKNLCVHTKSEGGFTLKFQDFPHTDSSAFTDVQMPNSAHSELDDEFDAFMKSQYEDDAYDIELDFMNDDDWSEVNAIWNIKDNSNDNVQRSQVQVQQQHSYYDDDDDDDEYYYNDARHRRLLYDYAEDELLGSLLRGKLCVHLYILAQYTFCCVIC